MSPEELRRLLDEVAAGRVDPGSAADRLRRREPAHTAHLPEATLDLHRNVRCGFPEVIYGEGKTEAQVLDIAERLVQTGGALLATRLGASVGEALASRYPEGQWHAQARCFHRKGTEPLPPAEPVAVICAGTSDLPVAEEAAITAEALGAPVRRVWDVGVAGLHRLLGHQEVLRSSSALVVVAGMEGALPSVVGGLTDRPVIAVPTSVGYGAHLGGLAPLLGMLNSCATGVVVVNIDNGFSAGFTAARIGRIAAEAPRSTPEDA